MHWDAVEIFVAMLIKWEDDPDKLVLGQGVDTSGTETKGTVLIKSAEELENYSVSEEKRIEEHIKVRTKLLT